MQNTYFTTLEGYDKAIEEQEAIKAKAEKERQKIWDAYYRTHHITDLMPDTNMQQDQIDYAERNISQLLSNRFDLSEHLKAGKPAVHYVPRKEPLWPIFAVSLGVFVVFAIISKIV